MRYLFLRRAVLGLLLLTFVSGPWLSATAQEALRPCTMAMFTDTASDAGPMQMADKAKSAPCQDQDSTPACMKRICCLAGAISLAPPSPALSLFETSVVLYLPTVLLDDGRSVEPELFPPITA